MAIVKKTFVVLMCVALMLVFTASPVSAMSKEEALEERDELQQQLIEINARLAEINDEVSRAREQANTLYQRIAIVEQQIALIEEAIELIEIELAIKQQELDDKVQQREETFAEFETRIRQMYMSSDVSDLTMLLGVTSYSEFLVESEYLRRVSDSDNDLIDRLEEEERQIEEARDEINVRLQEQQVEQANLDTKRIELAQYYAEANAALSVAEAYEQVLKSDQSTAIAALNAHEQEWGNLMGTGMIGYVGGYFTWPVPGYSWISSPFGPRTLYGQYNMHYGIDIAGSNIYGKNVIASNSGRVVRVRYYTTGYGYHIMIDHGDNNWTVYAHLSGIIVKEGDWVGQGQTIGYIGSTGNSTGPHLHFEIRLGGVQVNPEPLVENRYA